MNTKVKLISTISVFCMILALLVTGVWAVSTANVTLGGTVRFTADNIHAKVTGSITGTNEDAELEIKELNFSADTEPEQADYDSWNNHELTFTSANLITMTITVENLSSERPLHVTVTDNTTTSNIKKEFASTVDGIESGDTYALSKGTITYTIKMSVDQLDLSASANYSFDVDLRDANAPAETIPDVGEYSYLTFDCNDETGIATITGYDGSCNDNVVIPGKFMKNNKQYTVTTITACVPEGERQYSYFTSAIKVTLPDTIKSIGYAAFQECSSLEEINIPEGVIEIGGSAFVSCSKLKNITLPAGVQSFSDAFVASGLENITILGNIAEFPDNTFLALSLKTITIKSTTPPIVGENAFTNTSSLTNIYVPSTLVETYKNAEWWSDFADIISAINE